MDRFNGLDVPDSLAEVMDPAALAFVVYFLQAWINGYINPPPPPA